MPTRRSQENGRSFVLACALWLALPVAAGAALAAPRRAPSFDLPTIEGRLALEKYRGHVVYLDFWASWCGPCRTSFPWLAKLAAAHAGDSLVVIAVNLDKERALADAFLKQYPAAFAIAFDPRGTTAEAYQVSAMPTSFLIGRDGMILYRHAGFDLRQTAAIETRVTEALKP